MQYAGQGSLLTGSKENYPNYMIIQLYESSRDLLVVPLLYCVPLFLPSLLSRASPVMRIWMAHSIKRRKKNSSIHDLAHQNTVRDSSSPRLCKKDCKDRSSHTSTTKKMPQKEKRSRSRALGFGARCPQPTSSIPVSCGSCGVNSDVTNTNGRISNLGTGPINQMIFLSLLVMFPVNGSR